MIIDELLIKMKDYANKSAIVWRDKAYSYHDINLLVDKYALLITEKNMSGQVVAVIGDYSPHTMAIFIALFKYNCIVLPLTNKPEKTLIDYFNISEVRHILRFDEKGELIYGINNQLQKNEMMRLFKDKKQPGLVIFSSGSTGVSKGILHNVIPLLEKFRKQKKCVRIISFLLFDHIGGINTLFYTLFNGGCLVIPKDRSVIAVCAAVQEHGVQAITTTPTFLNLLLLSSAKNNYCLNSLRIINYGTEIMPEYLLLKLHESFPSIRFSQAYGLSEVGVLPIRSISSTSTLIKIDESDDFSVRIKDGMLEIKSKSSMVGYLNCPQPVGEELWFKTGDLVEVQDGYIKILGRQSDLINVGGSKVYPAEVENVLQQMENVEDVLVYSMPNSITGNTVVAKFKLSMPEDLSSFHIKMRNFCYEKLSNYKIPQKIELASEIFYSERYKKIRKIRSK